MSIKNHNETKHGNRLRLLLIPLAALALLLAAPTAGSAQDAGQGPPEAGAVPEIATDENGAPYVEGELLVVYEDERKAATEEPREGEVTEEFPELGVQVVEVEEVEGESDGEERREIMAEAEAAIGADRDVAAVERNYVYEPAWSPNDTLFPQQSNSLPVVRAPQGWDVSRGGGATIAVLDEGIATYHPEFAGKISKARNLVDGENPGDLAERNTNLGHGTAVASVAAANTGNSLGIAGAAPRSRLIVGKVMAGNGYVYTSALIRGVKWSADSGADVINMSLSGSSVGRRSEALENAVDYAWNRGSLIVASTGNTGKYAAATYPAAYKNVVGVGAIDGNNLGLWSGSTYGPHVDLVAPGVGVVVVKKQMVKEGNSYRPTYGRFNGTSFAAPHVAALAALLKAQNPNRTPAQIYSLMRSTARDLGAAGRDDRYGHGLINYEAALKKGR